MFLFFHKKKMGSFWSRFYKEEEEELSPLELAEKTYTLACEAQAKFVSAQIDIIKEQQEIMGRTTNHAVHEEGWEKCDAADSAIKRENERVEALRLFWIGLKTDIPDSLKEYLGCDLSRCSPPIVDAEDVDYEMVEKM